MTERGDLSLLSAAALLPASAVAAGREAPEFVFLILAHDDPAHLSRLVRSLDHPRAFVLVHVDGKAPIRPFALALKEQKNVLFLADRYPIMWGSYAMVEAMIALLRAATQCPTASRFVFLSGADFPLSPIHRIVEFFEQNEGHEFVRCEPIADGAGQAYRLNWPHLSGMVPFLNQRATRSALENRLQRELGSAVVAIMKEKGRAAMSARQPYSQFFKGSQWMSLTRDGARELLEMHDTRPEIGDFFRYTAVPDESMLQTMVMNSSRRAHVDGRATHHVRWVKNEKGTGAYVVTLSRQDDLAGLQASGALFARKFRSGISDGLVDALAASWRTME